MPRLVLVSDTHTHHRELEIPEADILVYAGDFSYFNTNAFAELLDFNNWLGEVPCKHKIVIAGNHDLLLEKNPEYARYLDNCTYLNDSGCEVMGLKFWGSPVTPTFCNWAFNRNTTEIKKHWELIPNDTDVLITHGPPYGILDKTWNEHVGCKSLLEKVKEVKPLLHVFGHIHYGRGVKTVGDTAFVNAAMAGKDHKLVVDVPYVLNVTKLEEDCEV